MSVRKRAEWKCKCGCTRWQGQKDKEACTACGKKRTYSKEFWYRFKHKGRPHEGNTGQTSRGAALKVEALIRSKVIRGEMVSKSEIPTLGMFAPVFKAFTEQRQDIEPATREYYLNGLAMLEGSPLWSKQLNEITSADVSVVTFKGRNGQPVSGSTANNALRTLQRLYSLAEERGVVRATPTIPLRKERKRKAIISELWMENLLLELAPPALHDFMIIMLDSGMRPGEILRTRWQDVLWTHNQIVIPVSKSECGERDIPMSQRIVEVLRAREKVATRPLVFPSEGNMAGQVSATGHVSLVWMGEMFRQTLKRAREVAVERGLPALPEGLVLYSCRHTFATNFQSASGGDRGKLKELMGHSSMAIGERYVHPSTAGSAEIINGFNDRRRAPIPVGKRA